MSHQKLSKLPPQRYQGLGGFAPPYQLGDIEHPILAVIAH